MNVRSVILQRAARLWRSRRSRRAAAAAAGLVALGAGLWCALPFPRRELDVYPAATELLDRRGAPLRLEFGPGDLDCRPRYEADPGDWICRAIVSAEDRRFWDHAGIDVLALARAAVQNASRGRVVSGASTISTQVIRLVEPRRRTLWAKAVEAFRALQMERQLGKRAILSQYLNRAPFGGNLVGIEAASRRYFGKRPQDLSLAEAALLAGLPQSPSRLRPDRHPGAAHTRQAYVLARMEACGAIDAAQRVAAAAQPIVLRPSARPFRAPHFCEMALEDAASSAGRAVRTTLDPALQRTVEAALARGAAARAKAGIHGGAVVVLEVRTGAVRALAGSPDYADRAHAGQVNAARAPRSAGSTLKPFAFAQAMDAGRLSPLRVLADVPRSYRDYRPGNFDGDFLGLVTARDALILSLNMPALGIVQQTGAGPFHECLRRVGLDTLDRTADHYGLGLAIGNGPVRLTDLAGAYACLARGGTWIPPRLFEDAPAAAPRRVFSAEAAWLVADILSGEERSMDALGHLADARLPRLAWKTGTSAGFRDAWAMAFNPEWVIGVWIGNPDGAPAPGLIGARAAAPVVWEIFRELHPANDGPWFARPAGIERRTVCPVSGQPPGPHCPRTIEDWAIGGVTRCEPCAVHRLAVHADSGRPATADVIEVWPAEVQSFLDRQRVAGQGRGKAALAAGPRIVHPVSGTTFRRMDDVREASRTLALTAEAPAGGGPLYWFVDDRPLSVARANAPVLWPVERGRHTFVCADPSGRSDRSEVMVE